MQFLGMFPISLDALFSRQDSMAFIPTRNYTWTDDNTLVLTFDKHVHFKFCKWLLFYDADFFESFRF